MKQCLIESLINPFSDILMIQAQSLSKQFRIYQKKPGFAGSLSSLFYRHYETKTAVNSFDIDIQSGEIVALLGPNGAGKTTLMKMFSGIIVPSSGELMIAGHNPARRERLFRKKIALVMGQKSQLWWDLPAMDSFQLLQKYYELDETAFKIRVGELAETLDVKDLLHIHVRKLSLGERMKVELMASLLHEPEVIFLDEPTIGLDLVAQNNIRNFIKAYHQKHRCTIVLTSHYMADVEALCSRLILILKGKKSYDGPIDKFTHLLGHHMNIRCAFQESVNPKDEIWEEYDPQWSMEHSRVDLSIPKEEFRDFSARLMKDYPVTEFNTEKASIERVMKTLMEQPELLDRERP